MGKLFAAGLIEEYIGTHGATSNEASDAYLGGQVKVQQFFPMGTWAEKVRAGAMGLGGALVPVGVGTWWRPSRFDVRVASGAASWPHEQWIIDALGAEATPGEGVDLRRFARRLFKRLQQAFNGAEIEISIAPLQGLHCVKMMVFHCFDQFGIERIAAACRAKSAIANMASSAPRNLSHF